MKTFYNVVNFLARVSIVLNIERMEFVLQTCEKLYFA